MPLIKTILFDLSHNEMLNIDDKDFDEFSNFLKRLNLVVKKNEREQLTKKVLDKTDLFVIGNPIDNYFSSVEVKSVVDFVRNGGRLLLLSEYGSDFLQKTNLNDISSKFGIFFEKNIVKEANSINQNCTSLLHIQSFQDHNITKNIRELNIGGTCSLFLNSEAKPLLITPDNSYWSEIYNASSEQWIREEEKPLIISAFTEFGKGKVAAIGDIDIFTSNSKMGIKSLDNRKFLQNLINWLVEPVEESKVTSFVLDQIGELQYEIKESNKILNNIIETLTILEKRITNIEENSEIYSQNLSHENSFESKSLQEDKL